MKADNILTTNPSDTFTTPLRRPRASRQSHIELRALCACAARHVEECHHLRSELNAILPNGNPRALDYTQHLLDESETRWQVCIDRICAIGSITVLDLIEKATTIIDARIMREAGAETEGAEQRLATSIALDLLAWKEGRVR